MHYIHKYTVSQEYGGPEEGGWWYDSGNPVTDFQSLVFTDEEEAYAKCRELNAAEAERRKTEEDYGYTSVLAYKSTHYTYSVEKDAKPKPYPTVRPHYE